MLCGAKLRLPTSWEFLSFRFFKREVVKGKFETKKKPQPEGLAAF